ncbi:MAG: PQQ-binding-like beta-propeller repeat protein [Opitutaceae bacterium]
MRRSAMFRVSVFLFSCVPFAHAGDWPGWRGPTADGHAASGQKVPLEWSETAGVRWKTPLRGRGHSSPTLVGNRIYLTTATADEQALLCLDRASGRLLWDTVVHRGQVDAGNHRLSNPAAGSVAWDGERLFVNFPNAKGIHTSALTPEGKLLWQTRITDFVMHQGFGSSPVVFGQTVLVSADHRGGGKVLALDRATGRIVWSQDRPKIANYASPAVLQAAGRTQVVLGGCNLVSAFDPQTGRKLWEIEGATEECVTTAVTDGKRVFVSGGYPRNNVTAVEADGSGRIAWQNTTRVYVPSMLVRGAYLYAVLDAGQVVCWRTDTGAEVWREKVDRDFYGSPVMVGDRIYVTNLRGVTFIVEVSPAGAKVLAQNKLGDESLASPAIAGGRIYLRASKTTPERQDFLWCIGE